MSSTAYSGPTASIDDSTLVFTVKQAKWLLKRAYKAEELTVLQAISQERINNLLKMTKADSTAISLLRFQLQGKDSLYTSEKRISGALEKSLSASRAEVRRQKRHKWVAIGAGGLLLLANIARGLKN